MNPDARKVVRAYILALCRFFLIWYGTLLLGFLVIVPAVGFHLWDGWNLIAERSKFFILVALFPFPIVTIQVLDQYVKYRLAEWERKQPKPE